MPPPRPDPTPSRGNEKENPRAPQPAASEVVAPPSQPSGGSSAWLPLGVALVVMPLVAYGMTTFVLLPQLRKSLAVASGAPGVLPGPGTSPAPAGTEGSGAEVVAVKGQRQSVVMNKLLVNVAGTMASRYLLTSMTLIGDASDFPARVAQNEPKLRDMATGLMMMKTISNLEKPGARNLLRGELIAGFNTILGNAAVLELYFTEFAIQ